MNFRTVIAFVGTNCLCFKAEFINLVLNSFRVDGTIVDISGRDKNICDKVRKQIADLPEIVSQNEAYRNAMMYSDQQNARAESDRATTAAILATMSSGIELYKAVNGNESFRNWILDMVFRTTYTPPKKNSEKKKTVLYSDTTPASYGMVAEEPVPYGRK